MKANELRIGNYYNQFGYTHQATGSTISELEKAPESQLWCKPIPLDESWLIRAGFRYKNGRAGGQDEWDGYGLWSNGDVYLLGHKNGKVLYYNRCVAFKYEYVHQLQNLFFALTGTELQFAEQ